MKLLAFLIAFGAAAAATFGVWTNLRDVFGGWVPWVGGGVSLALVFSLVYFPLLRPLAAAITEQLINIKHRVRDTRAGTGIGDVPVFKRRAGAAAASTTACTICGAPQGPVCDRCREEMARG